MIPREIRMAFKHLEGHCNLGGTALASRGDMDYDDLSGVDRSIVYSVQEMAWALATERITSHATWPLFLPRDSQKLAEDIYEELQKKLRAHDLDKYCAVKKGKETTASSRASQETHASPATEGGAPPSADNV